jgi:predicted ATP-dependent protease
VQAIGGVNEKIEGFFDVCQSGGLTGHQGVLIPASNQKHLMLRPDVVRAAEQGLFHIYPIETIGQGIELLTGKPAGVRGPDGNYPKGTINGLVEATLRGFAEARRSFAADSEDDEHPSGDEK